MYVFKPSQPNLQVTGENKKLLLTHKLICPICKGLLTNRSLDERVYNVANKVRVRLVLFETIPTSSTWARLENEKLRNAEVTMAAKDSF